MNLQEKLLHPLDIDVSRLPAKGRELKVSASEEERQNICRAFHLLNLDNLDADIRLAPWRRNGVRVIGTLSASLAQPCVVTLEPVTQLINEEISTIYLPEGSPLAKPKIDHNGEMVIDAEGDDLPETFSGTMISISELIVEYLALAIDPHPRIHSAKLPAQYADKSADNESRVSPFAVLSKLKIGKPN